MCCITFADGAFKAGGKIAMPLVKRPLSVLLSVDVALRLLFAIVSRGCELAIELGMS